jgi:hypothetical protein
LTKRTPKPNPPRAIGPYAPVATAVVLWMGYALIFATSLVLLWLLLGIARG